MLPIRCLRLPIFAVLCLGFTNAATAADLSLGDAVRQTDAKYLEAPEAGLTDSSPRLVVGGGEDGLPPLDEEMSFGPLRVTLTYVEGKPAKAAAAPALGDIPEEAMLPDEMGLGEVVPHTPIVTIYFDDPNPIAPPPIADEGQVSDNDQSTELNQTADQEPGQGVTMPMEAAEALPPADVVPAGLRIVAMLKGDSAGLADPPVSLQIAELDPSNPYPEIVVSFFTGGAHCCSVTHIVTSNADGSEWTTLDMGQFDGGPMLAVDLDGNGVYEFETRHNGFLSAFACYACSEAPLRVLALEDGKLKDVSADKRFQPAHAAWLKTMIVGVPEEDVNGFLAGYVAQKIRLGEDKEAFDLMLTHYDRKAAWGLCDQDLDQAGECPGTKVAFPQGLERMLKEHGFRVEG